MNKQITERELVDALVKAVENAGRTEDEGPPGMTAQEIADVLGVTKQTATTKLRLLIKDEVVGVKKGRRRNTVGDLYKPPVYFVL